MFTKRTDKLGNPEMIGLAKLVAPIGEKEIEYTNSKGEKKSYRLTTIEIALPNGKTTQMVASVSQGNLDRMEESGGEFKVGDSYLTTLRREDRNDGKGKITFARVSHLQNAVTDEEALDSLFSGAEVKEPAVQA